MPTLDFNGKQFIRGHHLTVPIKTLEIDEEKSCNGESEPSLDDNLIIHDDNLEGLKALLPSYANSIKCIYIDPPYNTGNVSWKYNDNVNTPHMQAWLNKNVKADDLERHDKWLCMMWPRLHLLHDLLSDDGVIFISIDDNEQHHLHSLMDEIFGETNFVANLIWRKKAGGGQDTEYFAREHEYILCYRKSDAYTMQFRTLLRTESEYPRIKNGRKCKFLKLEKWGSNAYREDRPTMYYSIKAPDGTDFFPKAPDGKDGNWRTRPTALDESHIHWEKKERWTPYEVIYFDEIKDKTKIVKERTIYYDIATTTNATNEQKLIFGKKIFDTSKPLDLIRRLILLSTDADSIILDSFAGSGTTAHAVLALNKEDDGNRKFILIEREAFADNITAQRVRRVINGVENAKDPDLKEGLGGSFTYCTLGDIIEEISMLTGENLPDYDTVANYIAFVATGKREFTPIKKHKDYCFGETENILFYLIYEPSLEFMQSRESALNYELARKIENACKNADKKAYVYASHKNISQKDLTDMQITFCQLPYNIYRIKE